MRTLLIVIVAFGMVVTLVSTAEFWRAKRETVAETEGPPLESGDRVLVSGGYDPEPEWLVGVEGHAGTLERFSPQEDGSSAAIVRLDAPTTAGEVTGGVLVMNLRNVGATWSSGAIAHIHLCESDPETGSAENSPRCEWVESHASLRLLDQTGRKVSTR
jgi:hypothetical protein